MCQILFKVSDQLFGLNFTKLYNMGTVSIFILAIREFELRDINLLEFTKKVKTSRPKK